MKAFLFALLTALIWGTVPILEKIGLRDVKPYIGLFFRSFGVIIGIVLFYIIFRPYQDIARTDIKTIVFLALGGFLASIVGQLTFYNALKFGDVSKVVPISAIYPLVSFALALFLLGEQFTPLKLVGVVLVLIGISFLR